LAAVPGLINQLKAIVARRGGTVLSHDGGIEENLAALPGLISRADAAFFPVDCISHSAVGKSRSAAGWRQAVHSPSYGKRRKFHFCHWQSRYLPKASAVLSLRKRQVIELT
jgi:hypothetical protein